MMGWCADNPAGEPLSIVQASRGINDMQAELDERHELSTQVQELESTEGQIAALEGKGYAVVKLPAPEGHGGWQVGGDDEFIVWTTTLMREADGEFVRGVMVDWGSVELNLCVDDSRSLAASLIAAAVAAEQVQP